MREFERVDHNRTLTLSGSRQVITDEPAFVALARDMNMRQLMTVAEPLGRDSDVMLAPEDARLLTLFCATTQWRPCFESTLQCMSCNDTGTLLTAWLSKAEFISMLAEAQKEPYLNSITSRLKQALQIWESKLVDEVFFDWYAKA